MTTQLEVSDIIGAADSFPVQYKTTQIEGLDIFYREAGDPDNPTILLLHGFPTSSFMFRELIPLLALDYHVVAPDYPGFGLSSAPPASQWNYTFDHLYEVIHAFTHQLGLDSYSLYMQDYGGPVGFRLASRHPEKVQALIIQNSNAYEEGLTEAGLPLKTFGETGDPKVGAVLEEFLTLEMTRFQFLEGAAHPERVSPDNWLVVQPLLDRTGNKEIQMALFRDYASNVAAYPSWHEYLRRSQPPVLVTWGQNDPIFSTKNVDELQRDVHNIEVHLLDGGHFALDEYPGEIAAFMRAFLAKNIR